MSVYPSVRSLVRGKRVDRCAFQPLPPCPRRHCNLTLSSFLSVCPSIGSKVHKVHCLVCVFLLTRAKNDNCIFDSVYMLHFPLRFTFRSFFLIKKEITHFLTVDIFFYFLTWSYIFMFIYIQSFSVTIDHFLLVFSSMKYTSVEYHSCVSGAAFLVAYIYTRQ